MTRFLLIRHGSTDAVGKRLVGRAQGVALNEQGRMEASALAEHLRHTPLDAIYSSPIQRALETATAVAEPHGLIPILRDALTEVEFGDWTGKSFTELGPLPEFRRFNAHRSGNRPPGGEHVLEVQARMVGEIERIAAERPHATIALVGHADPIRAVLGFYLGVPVDLLGRFEIATGSVSTLLVSPDGTTLLGLNDKPRLR